MPGTCWSVALPQVKPGEAILEPYGLADHGGTRRTLSRNFTCAERVPWAAMSSMGRPVVPISRCPEAPLPWGTRAGRTPRGPVAYAVRSQCEVGPGEGDALDVALTIDEPGWPEWSDAYPRLTGRALWLRVTSSVTLEL